MSASREKKNRQERAAQGVDPRAERLAKEAAEQKKNRLVYGGIAVLFVIVAVVVLLVNSGIFQRRSTALTVDGQDFTPGEVDYFYYTALNSVTRSNYFSYMGLDTSTSYKDQTMNAMAKMLLNVTDEGDVTWDQYLKTTAESNLAQTYKLSVNAKANGITMDEHAQEEMDAVLTQLKSGASQNGVSLSSYLKLVYGSNMTLSTFKSCYEMTSLASHFAEEFMDSLNYIHAYLQACYEADKNSFDTADFEYISFRATAESTTDADGNTVEATDAEQAAAKKAAQDAAADAAVRFAAGETLDAIAADYEDIASYTHEDDGSYSGTPVTEWVFDAARQAGDSDVVDTDSNVYFVLFHSRARQDYNTVNVRHILFQVDSSTLDSSSDTYDADLQALEDAAHADAERALQEWKDGGATVELFEQMVTELSDDSGSIATGGLYTGLYKHSNYVPGFLDWCFEDGRKVGDAGVVESVYGSHVMYLDSFGDPYWKVQATNTLKNDAYTAWLAENGTTDAVTEGSGMQYVGY